MKKPIDQYFKENPNAVILMNGGQGTELERRGVDVNSRVWSTAPFIEEDFWKDSKHSKHRKIVKDIYEEYIESGSEALMTITYQTSFTTISENTNIKTIEQYNKLLDRIVVFCRNCIGDKRYLIGSVGTYAAHVRAEYSGDYGPNAKNIDFWEYFKPQLEYFNNEKEIDFIALETIPNKYELNAMLHWDEKKMPKPFYIGLSVGDDGNMRDGTTFEEVAQLFKKRVQNKNLLMIGVNCTNYETTPSMIKHLHSVLPDIPLVCYSNSGEVFNLEKKDWEPNPHKLISWDEMVQSVVDNNVRLIGGCCRTTPADIKAISTKLNKIAE